MDKKCKKLGNRATKAERLEAHEAKVQMKVAKNTMNNGRDDEPVMAGLGVNHPEYGETTKQQAARMAKKSS